MNAAMNVSSATCRARFERPLDLDDGSVTTAGVIAIGNLTARIESLTWQARRETLPADGWCDLIELTAVRGHALGRIDEAERAGSLAERFVKQAPCDPRSFLARARMASIFHRFTPALADLDVAASLGLDRRALDEERAAVYQAVGRYDEALALDQAALLRRPDFRALGALATYHAERGEMGEAETWYLEARRGYRAVSPFPLAMLEFQCGQAWLNQGDLARARTWLQSAMRRLPAYVPVQGHLAEIDAAEGRMAEAIGCLRRLVRVSDDPEYATQLAHCLAESEASAEAEIWCVRAAVCYDELHSRHPEAYAEHAAEFWLTVGGDPRRALQLSLQNLAVRPTPRAQALVNRARCHVARCLTGRMT